ncbi:hypothetical protein NBRC10512_005652 [Rhodotorula toruloides]|uniref:RHTO0S15e00562g1_1 n=2 Tax=Rhodotorula toruloides TaxID=5286 RepID=A0A061BCJ6_RHOTO|nr:uncharacterized protein RHTO_03281 [Rhodotorula toruloides NP11]EMS25552.1 hypothetical protein RHTO_03281 [Rhodotorula toruloides NP11]CDR47685.1 RHTO0S15e00562g1_1 [Rhodotorula toruloides]
MSGVKEEPEIQRIMAGEANLARQAIAALGGGVGTSGSQNAVASGSGTQNGQVSSAGTQAGATSSSDAKPSKGTTVLFPHRTSFSTADEFFAECSTRLRSQYGYPANPSKRKDDKVTVRCFCHKLNGCPFRVCALKQQDGSWFVQNKACTWDHSHPASTTPLPPSISTTPLPASRPASTAPASSSFIGPQPLVPAVASTSSLAPSAATNSTLAASSPRAIEPVAQTVHASNSFSQPPVSVAPPPATTHPHPSPATIAQSKPMVPVADPVTMLPPSRPPSAASSKPTKDATSSTSAPP